MRAQLLFLLSCGMVAATIWFAATAGAGAPAPGSAHDDAPLLDDPAGFALASAVDAPARNRVTGGEDPRPGGSTKPPEMRSARVLSVAGNVFRSDGKPASSATVALGGVHVRTDAGGHFVLDCTVWPAADAALLAWEPGFEPAERAGFTATVPRRDGLVQAGPVQLQLGGRVGAVVGVVVDADGVPQKGWRVWVDPADGSPSTRRGIDRQLAGAAAIARTGKDGAFRLAAVRAGACRLIARRGPRQVENSLLVPATGLAGLRIVVE